MYAGQQGGQPGAGAPGAGAAAGNPGASASDEVIDAEYVDVDDKR
jgi:hypothetical protein